MKLKPDTKSIKFKILIYFTIFALILMIVLWSLQVLFLNTFYQSMKENKTNSITRQIKTAYDRNTSDQFAEAIYDIADNHDVYLYITYSDGTPFMSSGDRLGRSSYDDEFYLIKKKLAESPMDSVSFIVKDESTERRVLACGQKLSAPNKPNMIVYIISPLWPMTSTIEILKKQLLYVTFIAFGVALIMAIYLARRISNPIRNITKSANKLAQGEYGITFHGGKYTELADLADTLTRASIELEKSTSLQKDLIANVSHDLRTPLTMVKSYAEMIRDLSGDNPEKREKHLQVIIEEADRLNLLVSDMLTLSRMQSGAIVIERSDFNLYDSVESILMSYKLLMEEDGYKVNFQCPKKIKVNGDPERIKQVCANLINNALKFCGDDKTVNVTIKKKSRTALCQIQDHGPGIAPDELKHIWERYYKSSNNMVRTKTGTGLGLSIVKEILSLHKVRYGVNSELGKGTTFWFELPLV